MTSISFTRGLRAILLAAALTAGCAGVEPARDEVLFGRVDRGMSREDVQRLIGPPDETMKFPALRSESWDYHYTDLWGYRAVLSIIFGPDGRSQSKIVHRLGDGGGEQGGR